MVAPLDDRYSSVQEVIDALHSPTAPRVDSTVYRTVAVTPPKRGRGLVGEVLYFLSFIVPALILISVLSSPQNPQPKGPEPTPKAETSVDFSTGSSSLPRSTSPHTSRQDYGQFNNAVYYYEGQHIDGLPHGKGERVRKSDGARENGRFVRGAFVSGVLTHKDGTVEKGEFKEGLLDTKQGERTSPDAGREVGVFKRGTLLQGEMVFTDGTRFTGSFRDRKLNGAGGMLLYPNGTKWEGEFRDNVLHGKGKQTYGSGSIFEGEFRDNKLHGKGKMIFEVGTAEGEFRNGEFVKGKFKTKQRVDEGEFVDFKLQGQGTRTTVFGDYHEGYFSGGDLRKGKMVSSSEILEGEFLNGQLHGKGKKTLVLFGEVWEGLFDGGKLVGSSRKTFKDGRVVEGFFVKGSLEKGQMTLPDGTSYAVKGDDYTPVDIRIRAKQFLKKFKK